jgi:SAM-dependent methyltransferase
MGADSMLAEARAAWGDEVLRRRIAAARMDRVEQWAGCLVERRLLDIGCGTGDVLVEAARRSWSVAGVDDRPEVRRRVLAAGFDAFADVASVIAGSAPRPQMVTMFRSLELAGDPGRALAEAAEVLAPGGLLLVEVWEPYARLTALHNVRTAQRSRSPRGHEQFSVDDLDRAMSECGLDTAWSARVRGDRVTMVARKR